MISQIIKFFEIQIDYIDRLRNKINTININNNKSKIEIEEEEKLIKTLKNLDNRGYRLISKKNLK